MNGHGGNEAGQEAMLAWRAEHPDARVRWHDWWKGARVRETVEAIDADATHASWFENFPWTRLDGVALPAERKPVIEWNPDLDPAGVRALVGDGSFGGLYERPDEDVLRVWQAGVEEVRELIASGWEA